jgi:hypothetical protein
VDSFYRLYRTRQIRRVIRRLKKAQKVLCRGPDSTSPDAHMAMGARLASVTACVYRWPAARIDAIRIHYDAYPWTVMT